MKRIAWLSSLIVLLTSASIFVAFNSVSAASHNPMWQNGLQVEVMKMDIKSDGTGELQAKVLHVPLYSQQGKPHDLQVEVGDEILIHFDSTTKFFKRFGGKMVASDISVGDHLLARVQIMNDGGYHLQSGRDMSFWRTPQAGSRPVFILSADLDGNILDVQMTKPNGLVVKGVLYYNADTTITTEAGKTTEAALQSGTTIRFVGDVHVTHDSFSIKNVEKIDVISEQPAE